MLESFRARLNLPVFQATDFIAAAVQHMRLHGLWEGAITLPRPPPPPFDVETMEPIRPPWRAFKEWIPVENPEDDPGWFDQSNPWQPQEIHHDDRIFVLDAA